MRYSYTAYDRAGTRKTGVIEASSEHEAREVLRRDGLFATDLQASSSPTNTATSFKPPRNRLKHLVFTLRQLAVLISTGTRVVDALLVVERQTRNERWRAIIGDIRERVEEGESLSVAMVRHPKCFDAVCQSLVAAGESAGNLNITLDRLSRMVRRRQRMRAALVGALIYPALLICISSGVLVVMAVMVLPRFGEMFETLDAPLPASTAFLLDLSTFAREKWWVVLGSLVAGVSLLITVLRTQWGQRMRDRAMIRIPVVGGLQRAVAAGQIARLLSLLLNSRVPLLEAIELTRNTMRNREYRDLLEEASERVTKGEHLSAALANSPLIPPNMGEALRSAERAGSVAPVLADVADYIEEDTEILTKSLSTIIEPVILIAMGVLVAFVAISIFLPLFDLTASAQRSG